MGRPLTDANRLSVLFPAIAAEWVVESNGGRLASAVAAGSNIRGHWKCATCAHSWQTAVHNRTAAKSGCPACAGTVVSDANRPTLDARFTVIVGEWHASLNGTLSAADVTVSSNKRVAWECSQCAFVWHATVTNRTCNASGCPACSNNAVSEKNRLSVTRPEIASTWSTRNAPLTAADVSYGSGRRVWWACSVCAYEWEACVRDRVVSKTGCQQCHQRFHGAAAMLAVAFPEIALAWHPTLNGALLPSAVSFGSGVKVWWCCATCAHVWVARVASRTGEITRKCPRCVVHVRLTGTSMIEIALAAEFVHMFSFTNATIDSCRGVRLAGIPEIAAIDQRHGTRFAVRGMLPDIAIMGLFTNSAASYLLIEWDSANYHGARANVDIAKTKALCRLGHVVVRMREAPLATITPLCAAVGVTPHTSRRKIKTAVDSVLRHLLERYSSATPTRHQLTAPARAAIRAYLECGTTQNPQVFEATRTG